MAEQSSRRQTIASATVELSCSSLIHCCIGQGPSWSYSQSDQVQDAQSIVGLRKFGNEKGNSYSAPKASRIDAEKPRVWFEENSRAARFRKTWLRLAGIKKTAKPVERLSQCWIHVWDNRATASDYLEPEPSAFAGSSFLVPDPSPFGAIVSDSV